MEIFMRRLFFLYLLFFFLTGLTGKITFLQAEVITVNFSGEVALIGGSFTSDFQMGDIFTASYTFETETPKDDWKADDPNFGRYYGGLIKLSISFQKKGLSWTFGNESSDSISLWNDLDRDIQLEDQISIISTNPIDVSTLEGNVPTGMEIGFSQKSLKPILTTLLEGDDIPTSIPAFDNGYFHLMFHDTINQTTNYLQISFSPISAEPEENLVLTNTSPNATITADSDIKVYGTAEANSITLESGATVEIFNFPGNNTITIKADSSLFTVSRSGAYVTFEGTDGTVLKMPATTSSQSIVFNEGSRSLIIDSGRIMFGDQVVYSTPDIIEYSNSDIGPEPLFWINYDPESPHLFNVENNDYLIDAIGKKNMDGTTSAIESLQFYSNKTLENLGKIFFNSEGLPKQIKFSNGVVNIEYINDSEMELTSIELDGRSQSIILPFSSEKPRSLNKIHKIVKSKLITRKVTGIIKEKCPDWNNDNIPYAYYTLTQPPAGWSGKKFPIKSISHNDYKSTMITKVYDYSMTVVDPAIDYNEWKTTCEQISYATNLATSILLTGGLATFTQVAMDLLSNQAGLFNQVKSLLKTPVQFGLSFLSNFVYDCSYQSYTGSYSGTSHQILNIHIPKASAPITQTFNQEIDNYLPTFTFTPSVIPEAVIEADPTSGEIPLTVDLYAYNSTPNSEDCASFEWHASDGQRATGLTTHLTFDDPSLKQVEVTLTVKTESGDESKTTVNISLNGQECTYIGGNSPSLTCINEPIVVENITVIQDREIHQCLDCRIGHTERSSYIWTLPDKTVIEAFKLYGEANCDTGLSDFIAIKEDGVWKKCVYSTRWCETGCEGHNYCLATGGGKDGYGDSYSNFTGENGKQECLSKLRSELSYMGRELLKRIVGDPRDCNEWWGGPRSDPQTGEVLRCGE